MSEYKCICCGAVRETDKSVSCSLCGYKMFRMPYNRTTVLLEEIESFVSEFELKSVEREYFAFNVKDVDKNRFPDYDKILNYVSCQDRTEDFLNNLLETVEQLEKHFSSQFSKSYSVSYKNLDYRIKQNEDKLVEISECLDFDATAYFDDINWKKTTLVYTETPNQYLWSSTRELLVLIEKLARKIVKFIKSNNVYGFHHKYHPRRIYSSFEEKTDFKEILENEIFAAEKILKNTYIVDIDDDGSEALKEMLTSLWHSVELIMSAPLFVESYDYVIDSNTYTENEYFNLIDEILAGRYENFDQKLGVRSFCLNKSEDELFELYNSLMVLNGCGFLIPRELTKNYGESEDKLNQLIGLDGIKESILKIKAYALKNKGSKNLNVHMCFLGNPGSGKTEVARCIAGILYDNGVLPTDNVVEVDRSGIVSQYFGATAEKTNRVIQSAMGGVLFVDEAYALGSSNDPSDYGKEAIDTLVKAMEDYRGKICIILAGYKNEMMQMLSLNPGFKSRIQFMLDFPNYSRNELKRIANQMLEKRNYSISDEALSRILDITDIKRKESNFANAREIRNILDQVIMCQNLRAFDSDSTNIDIIDVNRYISDAKIYLPKESNVLGRVLTGEEELEQLIGMDSVKRMVRKIKAYAKRNKGENGFNLHMCFYGNPGTGKTEVARIISRILYDAGVLEEAKLVETDGQGLLGRYVGETAPKTEAKINEAMNGVLFIDEAYSLVGSGVANSGVNGFGEEAIAVLLKEMEDKRGRFCTILAGYKDEMQYMLSSNPGLESRIQFTIDFPDYTREELGKIANVFLTKKKYEIEADALSLLLDVVEVYRNRPNFANARTIRNVLDQVIMNQNLRTEETTDNRVIIISDVEDYISDENLVLTRE